MWKPLQAVGWGIALIIVLGGFSHFIKTCAWRQAFTCDIGGLSWSRSFVAQLISDGIGQFGLAGKVIGEGMRISLLRRAVPLSGALSAGAIDGGVDIHDFGTTFKAYRGDLLRQLPLYGEMHRFIPALASAYGASICEIPIQNIHRKNGESHYNISRTFRVFFDLMTIRFLLRYMSRPLHFFGRLGAISMASGSAIAFWLLIWKVLTGIDVVQQHGLLLVFAAVLILVGLHLIALGLLGELGVWQYFNRSERRPYAVSELLDQQCNRNVPIASEGKC